MQDTQKIEIAFDDASKDTLLIEVDQEQCEKVESWLKKYSTTFGLDEDEDLEEWQKPKSTTSHMIDIDGFDSNENFSTYWIPYHLIKFIRITKN